ncbi:hypothetical protein J6590_051380 [Homalodisca vitripennis]|nr:hypothetical protein J6590_051380 [Homalodisca vitripennis]
MGTPGYQGVCIMNVLDWGSLGVDPGTARSWGRRSVSHVTVVYGSGKDIIPHVWCRTHLGDNILSTDDLIVTIVGVFSVTEECRANIGT